MPIFAINLGNPIHHAAGAVNPLFVHGIALDAEGNPIEGADVTMTTYYSNGTSRANRTAITDSVGVYQCSPDFDAAEWDVGTRLEVVAVFGSDYGSNYTIIEDSANDTLETWVNITYPFKLTEHVNFTLKLAPGWNFVTIPLIPLFGGPFKASNVGLQKFDVVAQYNTATGTYDKTYIVGVSPPSLDITFLPSKGYWISTTAWQNVSINGTAPSGPYSVTFTLPAGHTTAWINLGLMSLKTTWKASHISAMCSGGNVSLVAMYSQASKAYKTYIQGVPPSDFSIPPGQAVWVYVINVVGGSFTFSYNS